MFCKQVDYDSVSKKCVILIDEFASLYDENDKAPNEVILIVQEVNNNFNLGYNNLKIDYEDEKNNNQLKVKDQKHMPETIQRNLGRAIKDGYL